MYRLPKIIVTVATIFLSSISGSVLSLSPAPPIPTLEERVRAADITLVGIPRDFYCAERSLEGPGYYAYVNAKKCERETKGRLLVLKVDIAEILCSQSDEKLRNGMSIEVLSDGPFTEVTLIRDRLKGNSLILSLTKIEGWKTSLGKWTVYRSVRVTGFPAVADFLAEHPAVPVQAKQLCPK